MEGSEPAGRAPEQARRASCLRKEEGPRIKLGEPMSQLGGPWSKLRGLKRETDGRTDGKNVENLPIW